MNKIIKSETDCYMNCEIICPYCYEECSDDGCYVLRNAEETLEFTCEHCGKDFYVSCQINTYYTTTRRADNGEEITEWYDNENELEEEDE